MSASSVSVVIPTRDRPGSLARCLAALGADQGVELEVVVVDDGSRDATAVRGVVDAHERATLVRLDGRGPAAARNAGIREARGDIVLFTDDDCVASPGWAACLAREARTGVLAVGRTLYDATVPLVAASETIVSHAERRESFAATRNVAVRREIALAIPFDERFREAGGEDREWCRRLARSGTPLVRVSGAVVLHDPDIDLRGFLSRHARYGRAARLDTGRPRRPLVAYGQLAAAGFRGGFRTGALVLLAQLATLGGYAGRPSR